MATSYVFQEIAWKRTLLFLFLFIIPNFLVMQVQLVGPVDHLVGLGTAIDLVILLPLTLYFFGLKKRVNWLVLAVLAFWGLILANWMIPPEADAYLTYFNHSIIGVEALIIVVELVIIMTVVKKLPAFIQNYREQKISHYHFMLSFSAAIERTLTFKNGTLHRLQIAFRIVTTDIAALYYSLFTWRKKAPSHAGTFTFHKDGAYLGLFFLLVHAMALEVIAVHLIVSQFSHVAAWIFTALDVYALLFIISDYQAIRLSPVVLDAKGIHFQKGIRQYGFIPWKAVDEVRINDKSPNEVEQDKKSVKLALHGLEKEQIPYVIKLNQPVEVQQAFGNRKTIKSVYLKMDQAKEFNEAVYNYLQKVK